MPTPKKIEIVKKLEEEFKKAGSYVLADYRGLSSISLFELRRNLRSVEASLIVAKNTLIRKAANIETEGPTAILFPRGDALAAIKILVEFTKNTTLKVKMGLFEGQEYSGEEITKIAGLPPRKVLLSQLLLDLKGPMGRLVNSLTANQKKLVLILNELKKSRR